MIGLCSAPSVWAQTRLSSTHTENAFLTQSLGSRDNHDGDRFRLQTHRGLIFLGHLRGTTRASRGRTASLEIILDTVAFPGKAFTPVHARITALPSSAGFLIPTTAGAKIFSRGSGDLFLKAGTLVRVGVIGEAPVSTPVSRPVPAEGESHPVQGSGSYNGGGEMPF